MARSMESISISAGSTEAEAGAKGLLVPAATPFFVPDAQLQAVGAAPDLHNRRPNHGEAPQRRGLERRFQPEEPPTPIPQCSPAKRAPARLN